MSLTPDLLVGYLRKEFAKASSHRVFLFCIQILIALPGALSVIILDETLTYVFAIAGAMLLLIWWLVYVIYQNIRDAAQTARRTSLLVGGLGYTLSADENLSFQDKMTVTQKDAEKFKKPDYYYTRLPPGPARLAEMLHESAFYSAALQRVSGHIMLALIVLLGVAFSATAFVALPYVQHAKALIIMRIFLALLVFWMSADVIGACIGHRRAAEEVEKVKTRLQIARRDGYQLQDVLLIMGDYNSAVESAPESVPFTYRFFARNLNQKWAEYITNVYKV